MNKKGAIEMSVGTIVTIVLTVTVLILAIFLVQKFLLKDNSSIIVTEQKCHNEIRQIQSTNLNLNPSQNIPKPDNIKIINFSIISYHYTGSELTAGDLIERIKESNNFNDLKNSLNDISFDPSLVFFDKNGTLMNNNSAYLVSVNVNYFDSNIPENQTVCDTKKLENNTIDWCYSKDNCGKVKIDNDLLKLDPTWFRENCECNNIYYSDISKQKIDCNQTECSNDIGNSPYYHCINYKCQSNNKTYFVEIGK